MLKNLSSAAVVIGALRIKNKEMLKFSKLNHINASLLNKSYLNETWTGLKKFYLWLLQTLKLK